MSGIATLAGASVDWTAGPTAMPMVTTIGVIPLSHSVFSVTPTATTALGASAQQRKAWTAANLLAANHTPLAHTTLSFTHAHRSGSASSAEASQLLATVINRAECC
jgi:hypothetical protein